MSMLSEYALDRVAEYFECSVDELNYNVNTHTITPPNGCEYLAFENEDEAREAAIDYVKNLFVECGISSFNIDYVGGIESFVETGWFEEVLKEDMKYYAEDIETESKPSEDNPDRNRLEAEMEEAGCNTVEGFVEYLIDNAGDPIEWFKWNFGKDEFDRVLIDKCLIDEDKLAEAVVDYDGYGFALASYDGIEIDEDDFRLYRTN